jgi:alpha-amylase/alpha-mannosidase (GH57 family)
MPYLCIHGHFYQPPRENPWTDEIDRELTAAPFHNWNERINEECYRANAFARVLADDGRVVDILNNYEYISFNFGPTLLSWLRAYASDVYDRIREGDVTSRQRCGHGNAIAQVYNHVILPLATRRDKVTQVKWGLADFRHHFGREAEAIWLAETAVDEETLEVLAEAGMRFVILAPAQAARIRPLRGGEWHDVSNGGIDPSRAYLCRLRNGRSLACFFYDGTLAHNISFGDTMTNSAGFVSRLQAAVDGRRRHAQLIHFATDGETFGHHKKYAERTLIYAATQEAPRAGFTLTNYAAYLNIAPPDWEVQINPNTSWSCIHGVGRWSADCGCQTGRVPGGHQRWRAPLRSALDRLRDSLAKIYEREMHGLLRGDVWAARDAYGELLTHRAPERADAFLTRLARRQLSDEERERALTLLEMQKHALFMYTSCGWFFDDISGHETAQVLKYAARAIDLATRFASNGLTAQLLTDLEKAESNLPQYRHGAEVYRQLVLPVAIQPEKVAASHAIAALVHPFPIRRNRHGFRIEQTTNTTAMIGENALVCGHIRLTSEFTHQQSGWAYAALHLGGYNFAASLVYCDDPQDGRRVCSVLLDQPANATSAELMRTLKAALGPTFYGLGDLPPSDRRRLLRVLDKDKLNSLASSYQQIYTQHLGTIAALTEAHMPAPPELRIAAEFTLSHQLAQAAADLARAPAGPAEANLARVLELARQTGVQLDRGEAIRTMEQAVADGVRAIVHGSNLFVNGLLAERCAHVGALIAAADRLGFEIRAGRAQEMLLDYLRAKAAHKPRASLEPALQLAERLRLSDQAVTFKE